MCTPRRKRHDKIQAAHRLIPGMCKVMRALSLRMRAERVTSRSVGTEIPKNAQATVIAGAH